MEKKKPTFELEKDLLKEGKIYIAGVDEVGRGALAGPIVAAAIVFSEYESVEAKLSQVRDSKLLSASKRAELSPLIKEVASDFAFGAVEAPEIDQIGIGAANIVAFERALDQLKRCGFALIDGRKFRGFSYSYRCLEKGESKSISIAAASIIAKVHRDEIMEQLHCQFPLFGWENNKGYGSKNHLKALRTAGPSIHHRKCFIRFLEEAATKKKLF